MRSGASHEGSSTAPAAKLARSAATSARSSGPPAVPARQSFIARVTTPCAQNQGPAPTMPAPITSFAKATWYCVAM